MAAASPFAASPICNANVKSPHVVPVSFTPHPHPSRPLCSISSSDQPADSKTQRHKGGDKDFLNATVGVKSVATLAPVWDRQVLLIQPTNTMKWSKTTRESTFKYTHSYFKLSRRQFSHYSGTFRLQHSVLMVLATKPSTWACIWSTLE